MSATLSRIVPADVLTPIGAYRALAASQASCLLESVESGGRISRYSFIGLDYLDAAQFDADATLYERVRAFVEPHRRAAQSDALGGALVTFAYDAARPAARLPSRALSDPAMPAAYVAIPATWLIFDHFSDMLTIWTFGDDSAALARRIDGYVERLLAARPSFPGDVRARGDVTQSMARDRYLELAAEAQRRIFEGDVYQLQLGVRFTAELEGDAFDLYRSMRRHNPSPYMFYVDTPFGQLLGASPEFLVRLERRRARLRPLAGTRSRGIDDD